MTLALPMRSSRDRSVTAVLVAAMPALFLAWHRAESPLHCALLAGFSLLLVALAVCDATTMLLPNALMYPGLAVALLAAGARPDHSLSSSLAGGLAGGAIMFALFVIVPGFGAGDVKLCALIGLLVGWPHLLVALMAGIICSGAVAVIGLLTRRLSLRGAMPYGPGLVAGALLVLLVLRP
jgi:leader peptidase (prepilin peptidase)/N-methyltransferase